MAKKIRRPRRIKIGQKNYKVKSRTRSWGLRHSAFGQIRFENTMIEIAEHDKIIEMVDTIIHEIFHGVIKEFKIKIDGRKEERFVRNLASGYCQALLENPQLLEWIYQKIKTEQQKKL